MKPNILIFDCEATSLHGSTFAVGALVIDRFSGKELDRFILLAEEGLPLCDDWVKKNVLPHLTDLPTCHTMKELRDRFFDFYLRHKETADIYADVAFPVETNFLSAIAADDLPARAFQMPYPLFDVANHVPLDIDRVEASGLSGLRKHHPLDDALASAACLLRHFHQ